MGGRWKWVSCSCLLLCSAQITRCDEVKRPSEGITAGNVKNPGLSVARGDSEVTAGRGRKAQLASSSELLFVSPNVVNMLPTDRQPLQLLDAAGVVVADVAWSIVDASVVELVSGDDGEPTLLVAKAVGQTRIVATSQGRSAYAEVTVFSSGTRPDGIMRWAAPALPGARQDLSKIVQSLRVDDGTPDLYVGDGARIRAFNQDGQEKWVWPVAEDPRSVQLLAGDDRGGAVVLAADANDNSIICLDSKGHQAWAYHLAPQFKLSDYAIDRTGLVYLVEDQKQGPSQVVGLDPDTGQPKFIVSVPMSVKRGINWKRGTYKVNRSEEHTSELQSRLHLVCRLLLEKKKKNVTAALLRQMGNRRYPPSTLAFALPQAPALHVSGDPQSSSRETVPVVHTLLLSCTRRP